MNSRTLVIAIVALFALCFVGSGAVMTLVFVERMATGQKNFPEPKVKDTRPPDDVPPAPEAQLTESPDDDELIETLEDGARPEGAAPYVAPEEGASQLAVFFPRPSKVAPLAALQQAVKGTKFKVYAKRAPATATPPYLELIVENTLDYAVVEGETLEKARGLDDDEKEALRGAKRVAVVNVITPVSVPAQLEAARVLLAFAKTTGGVLWDEQTQEYFSADAFRERRLADWDRGVPWAGTHFSVFATAVDKGGLEFATAGLRRFGLPELELRDVPRNSVKSGNQFVNAVAQALVETSDDVEPGRFTVDMNKMKHARFRAAAQEGFTDGATGRVVIELRPIGDGEIPTLEITFPGEGSKTVRVERGLSTFFGSSDKVTQVEHDEALVSLSKSQMEEFKRTVKPRFEKGLKVGEVLLVKAPFKTSGGGNEWMWVEVSRISATGNITGLLANDPEDVPDLESGQEVVVKEAQLFDWILKEADGSTTGNKTGELMQKRLGQ